MNSFAELIQKHVQTGALPESLLDVADGLNRLQYQVDSLTNKNYELQLRCLTQSALNALQVEHEQKWDDELQYIPFIQFPSDWKIQVIPPFHDAVVRFKVELPCGVVKSVYLDSRGSLGSFGYPEEEPYWEVYPVQDDVARCERADVEQLLLLIADTTEGENE